MFILPFLELSSSSCYHPVTAVVLLADASFKILISTKVVSETLRSWCFRVLMTSDGPLDVFVSLHLTRFLTKRHSWRISVRRGDKEPAVGRTEPEVRSLSSPGVDTRRVCVKTSDPLPSILLSS